MDDAAHLGPIAPNGNLPSAFVGYVALAGGIGRDAYIGHCYATNTITVTTGYAEVYKNVPLSDSCLQSLEFPANESLFGSPVLCVTLPLHQQPVVTAVLKNPDAKPSQFQERSFRKVLLGTETSFAFQAEGDKGTFSLSTRSSDKSIIRLLSPELKADLDVYMQGELNLEVEELVNFLTQEGFTLKIGLGDEQKILELLTSQGFSYADNYKNKVTITSEGFHYTYDGKGQKALLGESTVNWEKSLIEFLQKLSVQTVFGPSGPPVDQATLSKLLNELDQLLSEKTFYA